MRWRPTVESERRPVELAEAAVTGAQAHRRIDTLLDHVKVVTEQRDDFAQQLESAHENCRSAIRERDAWMRAHTQLGHRLVQAKNEHVADRETWAARFNAAERQRGELARRLETGHVCAPACLPNAHVAFIGRAELNRQLAEMRERAFDEVLSALSGWVEGAKSDHVALRHRDGNDGCGDLFHVADFRNMVADARRAMTDGDFDSVVDHDDEPVEPDADTVRRAADANADAYVDRIDELSGQLESALRQRDAAHAVVANLREALRTTMNTLDTMTDEAKEVS